MHQLLNLTIFNSPHGGVNIEWKRHSCVVQLFRTDIHRPGTLANLHPILLKTRICKDIHISLLRLFGHKNNLFTITAAKITKICKNLSLFSTDMPLYPARLFRGENGRGIVARFPCPISFPETCRCCAVSVGLRCGRVAKLDLFLKSIIESLGIRRITYFINYSFQFFYSLFQLKVFCF